MNLLFAVRCPPPTLRARRPARSRLIPIRTQFVVFPALLWIAQHFVRFVDLLELRFRPFLVFRHIRVILARQLPKRLLDVIVTGVA